jgi:proteasome lid subunit RPN8/RPN11
MFKALAEYFRRRRSQGRIIEILPTPMVVFTKSCQLAITHCLDAARERKHEGVCLLLGNTNGRSTVCVVAVRPDAETTDGSFYIPALEMAKIVDLATELRLQVVGQVHTHPVRAFHSDGDEEGAHIRYDGFVSMVVPDYGAALPDLAGSNAYMFSAQRRWEQLPIQSIRIVPDQILR